MTSALAAYILQHFPVRPHVDRPQFSIIAPENRPGVSITCTHCIPTVIMALETMTLQRPHFPELPRTPSLTSSSDSSGGTSATDFEVHLKRTVLPVDLSRKHLPIPLDRSTPSQDTQRRSRTLSTFTLTLASGPCSFVSLLKDHCVLSNCLSFLHWTDFQTLTRTCRDLRYLMRDLQLRDTILAKFVPGFKYALENRETHRFRDVPVTLHHLELFSAPPFLFTP